MLSQAAIRLTCVRSSLFRINLNSKRFRWNRPYLRGHWPEPLTQQTLHEFLSDINYFDEPKKFVNIGLQNIEEQKPGVDRRPDQETSSAKPKEIEEILSLLGEQTEPPELDFDDIPIDKKQLVHLATSAGIFRDLFGNYSPNRDQIRITPKQAENLDKLIPYYWITDQPFARVERNPKEAEPQHYFEPSVSISARFLNTTADEEQYAHTAYYGNIIPAAEALIKPSFTLDGSGKSIKEVNWTPGQVKLANFASKEKTYFTIALLNLDYLHKNSSNLHWMLTNIDSQDSEAKYDEICDYLPVHGIRGFGYSRFVFLVLQHESKLDPNKLKISSYSTEDRAFNAKDFIEQNKSGNMLPVGLSWFQTTWDESSNQIFHDYLKMKAPVYELIQAKLEKKEMTNMKYPGRIPFNIFLDHVRDKKEINEQVLLERLKSVDYENQYTPPKVPPTIFEDPGIPSWMKMTMFKKKNKVGYWRGLRPASATIPLNNNADLDYPLRPVASAKKLPPGWHNKFSKPKVKLIKNLPYSKPPNEHTATYIQEDHEVHLDKVKEMMKDLK